MLLYYYKSKEEVKDLDWIQSVQRALNYIEAHLLEEELDNDSVARHVYSSNANFQRIFSIVARVTIADYVRCRKLTLAGEEFAASADIKVSTDDYVFGAEAFRTWAKNIESGKFDGMKPEEFNGFFDYEIYVINLATNSGGCQSFLEKAQELNPNFMFLEDVHKQYRIMNYLWNGGHWIKDVHLPEEREEMVRLYGDCNLETLGGAFGCKLETLQSKEKRAPIVKQLLRFADCMDEVVKILNDNLTDN